MQFDPSYREEKKAKERAQYNIPGKDGLLPKPQRKQATAAAAAPAPAAPKKEKHSAPATPSGPKVAEDGTIVSKHAAVG